MITELRAEREHVEEAITTLELMTMVPPGAFRSGRGLLSYGYCFNSGARKRLN